MFFWFLKFLFILVFQNSLRLYLERLFAMISVLLGLVGLLSPRAALLNLVDGPMLHFEQLLFLFDNLQMYTQSADLLHLPPLTALACASFL